MPRAGRSGRRSPRPVSFLLLAIRRLAFLFAGPGRRVGLVYGLVCGVLWTLPLVGLLHVESSAIVAGVAFFTAGLSALGAFGRGASLRAVLFRQEVLLVVPWALLTLTLLWRPNCGYGQGLLFFVLFAPASVALAVALAYLLAGLRVRYRKTLFCGVGLAVALLGPVYDLGFHPQFYVYNHVFGGVLGPIYDEDLAVRPGLFVFRGLTLLWALLCCLAGRRLRAARGGARLAAATAGTAVAIGLVYAFAGPLGVNTPAWYLQARLGAVHRTPHFDLYYDPASLTADELRALAEDHEYHYARLSRLLGRDVSERIASYLYPDPETKARLTGARYTNVAPVWLETPQTHVLLEGFDTVFAHELAHVFSRGFGLPLVRASVLVGLVEGLAVALEPPDGLPSVHDQVSAAALVADDLGLAEGAGGAGSPTALARDLAGRLSPFGFWTGRGAVSYTTMGSFVAYLLQAYGAGPLARVYAWGDFEAVYGKPAEVLAAEWEAFVMTRPAVARDADALAMRRFAVPSLFEQPCPHYVPPYRHRYYDAVRALAAGDTARAWTGVRASLRRAPSYVPALDLWARLALARGDARAVDARLGVMGVDTLSAALAVRLGDAGALLGRPEEARRYYDAAYARLPHYAREDRALVVLRKSLVSNPRTLRILVSGAPPGVVAERLRAPAGADPVAATWRAVTLASAGRYDAAAALLAATPAPLDAAGTAAGRNLLRRQRWIWLARFLHRSGRPDDAAAYAARAARALRAAGDLDAAAQQDQFVAKMGWIMASAQASF